MPLIRPETTQIYLRLLGFVRSHWRLFALAVAAMLALASTEWMLPALVKPLIDEEFDRANAAKFYWTPILVVALFAVRGALSFTSTVTLHSVAQRTIQDLRAAMFSNLIRLPAGFSISALRAS